MATETLRDQLWNYTLKRTHRSGNAITASELSEMADTSKRSARDVLKTMSTYGILREEKDGRIVLYRANSDMGVEED